MAKALWAPQPGPQLALLEADWCYEILFGGARGGGKSIALLLDYVKDVNTYGEHWHGIFIRKTYKELQQAIKDSFKIYPQTGAKYGAMQDKIWRWPNGATLIFRNLERDQDAEDYQGHSYTWLGLDEAGNYPSPYVYFKMLATIRSGEAHVPTKRARLSANPGGRGHHWLKKRFIDPAPLGFVPISSGESGTKRERMYIPSKVTDNKLMMKNDPDYIENLKLQGSKELVQAWLYGRWDLQVDSFFNEFQVNKHVVRPFSVPQHWFKFRSFDWGSYRPFAVHWWAVSDGLPVRLLDGTNKRFPRGALVCYREWYGMETDRENVGIRMNNRDMARGIRARTGPTENIAFTTTDRLPFQYRGGITIAEEFEQEGVPLKLGDVSRVPGWSQLRGRLQGGYYGPMIYFVDTCVHIIRTLPILSADPHNMEDVDTECEDHAPDSARLACMERPYTRDRESPVEITPLQAMTFGELEKYDELYRED